MKRKLLSLITLAAMVIGMIPAIPASAVGSGPSISVSDAYAANSNNDGGATGFIATLSAGSDDYELRSMKWTITPSDGSGAKVFTYNSSNGLPVTYLGGGTVYIGLIIEGLNDSGAKAGVNVDAYYMGPSM